MDQDTIAAGGASRVGWFAAGALAVAALVALFLYADGYFDAASGVASSADANRTIIEAK